MAVASAKKRRGGIRRDRLDILFSKYIRTRDNWTCQRCGKFFEEGRRGGLHCAHIFGRRKFSVRWDPDNAVALCYGCHQWFGEHPLTFHRWAKERLGEGYDRIEARSSITVKVYRAVVLLELRRLLKGHDG